MKLEYTYKIINVDKDAKSMEIVYESPKYGVLHVGARLPWKDETLEQIVEMYNPARYWLEQEMEALEVQENAQGSQVVEILSPTEIVEPEEPSVSNLSMSKYQAFYSLASFGLLHKADSLVASSGSLKLKTAWANTSALFDSGWTVRNCKETVELQKLLGITSEQMDDVFIKGVKIDPNAPKKNMNQEEKDLFDKEIRIWELKEKLAATDYKALSDYDIIDSETKAQRQAWRDELRSI